MGKRIAHNKLDTKKFIDKAILVHDNKYSYSKSVYKTGKDDIIITCKTHGDFNQRASHHLSGIGCPMCSKNYKIDTLDFISRSKLHHGDKYDYSKSIYVDAKTKIEIICKEHGSFYQIPHGHMSGKGCSACSKIQRYITKTKTTNKFIEDAKKVHGDKYDYSLVKYKGCYSSVKITCKVHGVFNQLPTYHLSGSGCHKCGLDYSSNLSKENPTGWTPKEWNKLAINSKNFDSFKVYVIRCWNEEEEFYKIGRTYRRVSKRFNCSRSMPYNYEVIKEIIFDNAKDAFDKEYELKKHNRNFKYLPKIKFNGMHECFFKINLDI